jgi:biopolymer transport protein ExbB/TolQ
MVLIGLLVTVLGFVVSLLSLSLASSVGARLFTVMAGIAMSLVGILGIINSAYLKNAIWKR